MKKYIGIIGFIPPSYLALYALKQRKYVNQVSPSLRSPILYLPKHNKLSFYLQKYNWKKYYPDSTTEEHLRIEEIKISDSTEPSYLNLPKNYSENTGALLWLHGGGHLAGSAQADQPYCRRLALELNMPVFNVSYRLAGTDPFPADLEDAFQAFKWLQDHAKKYNFSPEKIGVAGASAGAGLAASLAQKIRDANLKIAAQVLIYPMLDDRSGFEPTEGRGQFIWSAKSNRRAWNIYLNGRAGSQHLADYAAPARSTDLAGLPATWIGSGSLDLFYPENLEYISKLHEANVEVESCLIEGMYHGADAMLPLAADSKKFWNSMIDFISRKLS